MTQVFFWNVLKCGVSSGIDKIALLNDGIERAIEAQVDIIFCAEVPKTGKNWEDFCKEVYGQGYTAEFYPYGPNGYFWMIRNKSGIVRRPGLTIGVGPRDLIIFEQVDTLYAFLHAKSGQTGWTEKELSESIKHLNGKSDKWVLGGDLNYHFDDLEIPKNCKKVEVWDGQPTQRSGSRLDYFIASDTLKASENKTLREEFGRQEYLSMEPIDHLPIAANIQPAPVRWCVIQ